MVCAAPIRKTEVLIQCHCRCSRSPQTIHRPSTPSARSRDRGVLTGSFGWSQLWSQVITLTLRPLVANAGPRLFVTKANVLTGHAGGARTASAYACDPPPLIQIPHEMKPGHPLGGYGSLLALLVPARQPPRNTSLTATVTAASAAPSVWSQSLSTATFVLGVGEVVMTTSFACVKRHATSRPHNFDRALGAATRRHQENASRQEYLPSRSRMHRFSAGPLWVLMAWGHRGECAAWSASTRTPPDPRSSVTVPDRMVNQCCPE
jgi:hypothetical protein